MTWTEVAVRVTPKVSTFVVNSTVRFLFDYAQARGLGTDPIASKREKLESAIYTYVNTRHLRKVSIEVYEEGASKRDEAIERFDLIYLLTDSDDLSRQERRKLERWGFGSDVIQKDVMEHLQSLEPVPGAVRYRVLLGLKRPDSTVTEPDLDSIWKAEPRAPASKREVFGEVFAETDVTWWEFHDTKSQ